MYRLTVVAGPNRGTSYPLHQGETTLGRLNTNSLVLNSAKISKRHCIFVVEGEGVIIKDQGSSNGTFVNGVLARTPRQIRAGDRVSVGEFVLELSTLSTSRARDPVALALPSVAVSRRNDSPAFAAPQAPSVHTPMPSDLKGRLLWILEMRVMPYFYKLLLKYEWRTMVFGAFGVFVLAAIVFAVGPIIDSSDEFVVRELRRRASFMAKLIVEQNSPLLQQRMEGKTLIPESISRGEGVRQAFLVDLESRIVAPADKLNQYLTTGPAAVAAVKAKQQFVEQGRVKGVVIGAGSHTIVAVEPLILYSPQEGRNIPVAMGVVALDATVALQGAGDMMLLYSEAFIWLCIFGLVIGLVLYRVTLKPLQVLHDEVDRALKGEHLVLTREIKFAELGQLLDGIDTALQRSAKATQMEQSGLMDGGSGAPAIDELGSVFRMVGEALPMPFAFCDAERVPLYLNTSFEDVTGIRLAHGERSPLQSLARDQAFGAFLSDLFDRSQSAAASGSDAVGDDFEFSGVPYGIQMTCLGGAGSRCRGFALVARRREGG